MTTLFLTTLSFKFYQAYVLDFHNITNFKIFALLVLSLYTK